MSAPRFDAVIAVDWSAAGTPVRGANSLWWALHRRDEATRLGNPATRAEAVETVAALITGEREAGRRVLVGFDFAFGYPVGVAQTLTGRPGWRAVWKHLAEAVAEGPRNASNRFQAAGRMNAAWPGEGPFWGNGEKTDHPGLPRTKPSGYGVTLPSEWRTADRRAKAEGSPAQPVWKLAFPGSVGSQTLTGIAALERLRRDPRLAGARLWPFETGLAAPDAPVVLVEIYPSLFPAPRVGDEPLDAAQVRACAERFAALDAAGALDALFAGPPDLDAAAREAAVAEEGWILGVGRGAVAAARPLAPTLSPSRGRGGGPVAATASLRGEARLEPPAAPSPPPAGGPEETVAPAARRRPWRTDGARGAPALYGVSVPDDAAAPPPAPPLPLTGGEGRGEGGAAATLSTEAAPPSPNWRAWERDPARIYARSFATVRAEARLDRFGAEEAELAVRLIHACGMTDVADTLIVSPGAVATGRAALAAGGAVLCDCEAVASSVIRRALSDPVAVLCTLNDPRVPALAAERRTTRSAAAIELWRDRLAGAVVAIGNAPTALFSLLELLDEGAPRPALILGFPVGFVGAAESKAELARDPRGVAVATLPGRRGGSAMAAAAVNALALGLRGDGT